MPALLPVKVSGGSSRTGEYFLLAKSSGQGQSLEAPTRFDLSVAGLGLGEPWSRGKGSTGKMGEIKISWRVNPGV